MSDEPRYRMAYACENEILTMNCTKGQQLESKGAKSPTSVSLEFIRANFGRFSISICNEDSRDDISVNCHSNGALAVINQS